MIVRIRRPPAAAEEAAPLGGRPRTIRFPPYWHRWFAKQTEQRLHALDDLIDAQMERNAMRKVLSRLKHALIVTFLGSVAVAHWFSDQVAWIADRLPILRILWDHLVGVP